MKWRSGLCGDAFLLQKTFVASGTNFVRLTKATTARFEQ